jgi:hypothetical protein
MVEPILTVCAVLLILYLGRVGASYGLFFELTSTVLFFFAMLVACRYWYLFTQLVNTQTPFGHAYSAFWGFLLLFILGCIPLIALLKTVNEDAQPKYPPLFDVVVGFVFGSLSAAIIICSTFTMMSVIMPKAWDAYDPERLGVLGIRLDRAPIAVYRFIEQTVFGIGEDDAGRTRLPTLDKADLDDFEKYWE